MTVRMLAVPAALALAAAALAGCQAEADHGREDASAKAQPASGGGRAAQLERGRYLVEIMDCTGCHTPGALIGQPKMERALAGGDIGFEAPGLGVVYPPNLPPHPPADLRGLSEAEIAKAVRTGERPDGRVLVPVMPWKAYSHLTDQDAMAVAAYLKSLQPVGTPVLRQAAPERAPAPYLTLKVPGGPAAAGAKAPAAG